MCKPISIDNEASCARLWMHEVSRVFYDRLINEEDREFFKELIEDAMKLKWRNDVRFTNVIFSNLLKLENDDKLYEEITRMQALLNTLNHYLEEYNTVNPNKMNLVFFSDAVNHICRIVRVLLQPRGNAMLIGVSGCGKQSLTRLASFMLNYKNYSIKLTKNYKPKDFREDLKEVLMESGCQGQPYTFLMSDTQIVNETFLEDINNILNTGDITNLYDQDNMTKIYEEIEPYTKKLGRALSSDVKYATYIERLRDEFHIILCMSPVGDSLRIRCRKFPSLVNCCTLDWYDSWSEEALLDVSTRFMSDIEGIEPEIKEKLAQMCPFTYKSVEQMAIKFDEELRRKVYITPKSYLDSISMYKMFLDEKRQELDETISRLSNGLQKLANTNVQVADLKKKLTEMKPELEKQSKMANEKANMVKIEKKKAEEVERVVEKEANEVGQQALEVKAIKDRVELKLEDARPAMEEAKGALEVLNDDDINEVKSFPKPPEVVVMVMEAVLTYFKEPKTDWLAAKKLMGSGFKDKLKTFEVEKCSTRTLDKVRKIINKKEFDPQSIASKAKAAACLAKWCIALESYAVIRMKVKPLEEELAKTKEIYDEAQGKLDIKLADLKKAKDHVQQLEKDFNDTVDKINELGDNIKLNEKKLERAAKLIDLTKEEGENWKETVAVLKKDMIKLIGDVFLGTASISYVGPFTGVYRDRIITQWVEKLEEVKLPLSDSYKLTTALGDAVKIRTWRMNGLPSDSVSIDNGIMCDRSERWPLMIDPQTQANQWIKNSYPDDLKIVKLSETDIYPKVVDTALRLGHVVLVEDVQEDIDPALDNILQKAIFEVNGLPTIHFGGKDITFDENFKFFMTSKLPNPHYLPEICIKLTIINFTVTFEGLEEQMLVDVVIHEKPEVEQKRDELVVKLAKLETDKRDVEIKILKTLAESNEETILDGDDLIIILETSKEKAAIIKTNLQEAIEIEVEITETRNQYKEVSIRGSILYFVITDLAIIDPMYQYSLGYVKKLFNDAIKDSKKSDELEERIENLIGSITKSIYNNICRGLFENHKMIYSFLICTSIERNSKNIDSQCWNFLLRGAGIYDKADQPENPLP
jgi:dynein heavy chain